MSFILQSVIDDWEKEVNEKSRIIMKKIAYYGRNGLLLQMGVFVVTGTISLSQGGTKYETDLLIAHKNYNSAAFSNDIGLIRVKIDIEFSKTVGSISLPTSDFDKENYPCKLSGWGSTSMGSSLPDKLQELDLLVIAQNECKTVDNMITTDHICTYTKSGEGACHGLDF
ncbi:chymotrypsin-1-like [Aphidius gifuensis]|uniref:chymotrypsin-1-like n=1 Tax=Aphidius gifuensis TaxID=684658 RepID=UPI001CDD6A7C|nr:chymotrypsin-1-like [Aphidius gifuensis]